MDDSDHDQDTESGIKRNARSAYESVVKIFSDMLERSEARIDRTSNIVEELTKACKSVETAYTSHASSLQSSRDTSQKNNAKLVSLLDRLTSSFAKESEDKQRRIEILEADKLALKEQLHNATDKYWKLQEDYRRLAESMTTRGTYTIGCNNGGSVNSKLNI
ncbi:unknown [Bacteroides sp. CAG:709]|nr:unknown [Bacteroides sp. CAG:709]